MKIGVLKILFQVKLKRRFAFKNKNLNFNIFLKSSIPQNLGQCTKKKNISKHVVTIRFFLKLTLYILYTLPPLDVLEWKILIVYIDREWFETQSLMWEKFWWVPSKKPFLKPCDVRLGPTQLHYYHWYNGKNIVKNFEIILLNILCALFVTFKIWKPS